MKKPTSSIDDFFFDDPGVIPVNPWKPLSQHALEQSPCCPIIGIHRNIECHFIIASYALISKIRI